jgi:hypothetical protein
MSLPPEGLAGAETGFDNGVANATGPISAFSWGFGGGFGVASRAVTTEGGTGGNGDGTGFEGNETDFVEGVRS